MFQQSNMILFPHCLYTSWVSQHSLRHLHMLCICIFLFFHIYPQHPRQVYNAVIGKSRNCSLNASAVMEFQILNSELLISVAYISTFPSGNVFLASLRYCVSFLQLFSFVSAHLVCYSHFAGNRKTGTSWTLREKEYMKVILGKEDSQFACFTYRRRLPLHTIAWQTFYHLPRPEGSK